MQFGRPPRPDELRTFRVISESDHTMQLDASVATSPSLRPLNARRTSSGDVLVPASPDLLGNRLALMPSQRTPEPNSGTAIPVRNMSSLTSSEGGLI